MKKILLFMVAALLVFGMMSCDQEVKTKTYKVLYNANGAVGVAPSSIEVEEGGTITVSSHGSLSITGYDFAEWNSKKDGSGNVYRESQSLKADRDIVLYAQWCIHSYSISYDLDGGFYPEGRNNPDIYTIETETFTLDNPERDGYEFLGWETSENDEPNKNVSIPKGTIGDLSFIAIWRPLNSYSISYDVNGCDGSIETTRKSEGESVELASISGISRKGYEFVCWNTEPDGTGKDYNPGCSYEKDEDLQLYAKWNIIKYSIEYNLNDGELATGKSNPMEYTVETPDIVLENPTRYGYEFVGWRYNDDSDVLASTNFSIKKGTTGNLSIIAVWKALDTYTVSYDANGGTGTVETQSKYKGESLTISSCEGIGKNGYTFVCWNTKVDGTGKDYNPNDSYSVDADLKLYAKWSPIKYSIKYDLDGGTFSDGSSITEYTIETDTFTLPIPMRAEYEFTGWKAKVSDEVQKAVSIEKGSTGNLSFTAVWRKLNRYTISYDVNGGSGFIESQSKLEGSSITISDADGIERVGYSFVCWNTKSDGTGKDYKPNDEYINDSDLVFYAKWNPIKYSIAYDLAGGTLPEGKSNPADYTIETETFTLVNPEKEGYEFSGWKVEGLNDVNATVSIEKGSTGGLKFLAIWKKLIKLSFDINGGIGSVPKSAIEKEGSSFVLPTSDSISKDGYVFDVWNTKPDESGISYLEGDSIKIDNDTVLYAIWKPDCFRYFESGPSCVVRCIDKTVESVVIPSTYKGKPIERIIFEDCSSLSSVTIPDSVTSIGSSAFSGCYGLESITIPDSVTSIGNDAFRNCSSLTEITIPRGVKKIADYTFGGCSSLTSVTMFEGVTDIGRCAFEDCSGLTCIVIPSSVTSLGYGAFHGCSGLTSIMIPEGVTRISTLAFSGCSGLTSITIPKGVTYIGSYAFGGCSGLTSVTIPVGVLKIGNSAFKGCSEIKRVVVDGLWGYRLFPDSKKIEQITILQDSKSIGTCAFQNCPLLVGDLVIPENVTSIGSYAFSGCSGLTSVTIPGSVTSIGTSSFEGCRGLTSVAIPGSVTSIGDGAFRNCDSLTSITIPESVTDIGSKAFSYCSRLTGNLTIPSGNIGEKAFEYCSGFTSITISEGVTSIGYCAFEGCSGLTEIAIPESVTSIGGGAFSSCSRLESIEVETGNPVYYSEGNCLIERDTKNLVQGCKNSVIPESVTSVGAYAFSGYGGLTSVTIPKDVTSIGSYAFSGCSGLTSVTIPDSVKSIGSGVFFDCSSLTEITIPRGVEKIDYNTFLGCSSLSSVTIPESVTSIGHDAFFGCSRLTSITIPESVTSIESNAFSFCSCLKNITYSGTMAQWNSIRKSSYWNYNTGDFIVHCTNGEYKYTKN